MPARGKFVPPGCLGAVKPAARGEFPFGLAREVLASPAGIGERIAIGDVHHRMVVVPIDIALWAIGVTPVGTLQKGPPLAPIAQIDRVRRRCEHQRAGINHVRQCARIILGVGWDLGKGDMAGRPDEFLELTVGDWMPVDPERLDADLVGRRFFRVMLCPTPYGTCRLALRIMSSASIAIVSASLAEPSWRAKQGAASRPKQS